MKEKYLNNAQQRALLINPWSYYGVMGRGTGKSVGILASRSSRIAYSMPGGAFGWYGDSYINLQSNLVPNVIKGWHDLGYFENIHFWRDKEPPDFVVKKMLYFPKTFKHTIIWNTGAIFFLISDDRPDSARGRSLQHLFGDEVKLINYEKMQKAVFPAIRGERIHFGTNPFFQGFTFTTDMPDREDGQWLLDKEKLMDRKQIEIIAYVSLELNKLIYQQLSNQGDKFALEKQIDALRKKLNVYRYKSVFYDTASTFVNIDALGLDAIDNMLVSLGWQEFKISVLNIIPETVDNMFYSGFGKRHLYRATNYEYYDNFGITSDLIKSSVGDKDVNHDKPLDLGMDFGNMNSLTVGQEQGNEFKALKFFHAVDPLKISDLAKMFVNYYKFHRNKNIDFYYDRAANARRPNTNITLAQEFRDEIIKLDPKWRINMKSVGWRNVPHQARRQLWIKMLAEDDNRFPSFRMNEPNCPELKSSMQLAPTIVVNGEVKKDKRSEHKKEEQLPMHSTNPSDSVDYIVWGKYSSRLALLGVNGSAYTVSIS